jgi:hypothetical protein
MKQEIINPDIPCVHLSGKMDIYRSSGNQFKLHGLYHCQKKIRYRQFVGRYIDYFDWPWNADYKCKRAEELWRADDFAYATATGRKGNQDVGVR